MNMILCHLERGFAAILGASSEADAARQAHDLGATVQSTEDVTQLTTAEQQAVLAEARFVVVSIPDERDLGVCDQLGGES